MILIYGKAYLPEFNLETLGMFLADGLVEKLKTQRKRITQISKYLIEAIIILSSSVLEYSNTCCNI